MAFRTVAPYIFIQICSKVVNVQCRDSYTVYCLYNGSKDPKDPNAVRERYQAEGTESIKQVV